MRQRLVLAIAVVCFAAGLVFPRAVHAQTAASSTIVGTVTDPSNAIVPGATIKITNVATGVSLTTTANDSGQYTFPIVTPGTYAVTVTKTGFENATVNNLVVDVSKSYLVNVKLQVGEVTQSVTVEAGAANQLETTSAAVGNVVNSTEMDKLPTLAHSALELNNMQPATSTSGGTEPRVAGAIDDQNTYTVDGSDISDNSVGSGTWMTPLTSQDSVQEFDAGITNPNSTFGRSSGGQYALVARHGTNEYHGSAYWYHQNSAFNANSWDFNAAGVPQPHLVDNRGGVRVGGPIFKDKTFFFANYELHRFPSTEQFTATIPTPSLRAGILTFLDNAGNKVQYNFNPANGPLAAVCGATGNQPCDPRAIGFSPAMQAFWNLLPATGNFGGAGDGLNETGLRVAVPAPIQDDFGVLRLDHNFTDKWRFSGSYAYWRDVQSGGAGGGQLSLLGTPSDVSSTGTRSVLATGQLTTLISATLTNTFRYSWARYWLNFQVQSPAASSITLANANATLKAATGTGISADPFVALNPAEGLLSPPIVNDAVGARFQDYFERSNQFTDTLDWTKGKHNLEFGTDDRRLPYLTDRADKVINGITSLVTINDTTDGNGAFLSLPQSDSPAPCTTAGQANCLPPGQLPLWNQLYAGGLGLVDNTSVLSVRDGSLKPLPFGTPLTNKTVQNQFYFYGQDNWRITNSLTINYGLSYGWQTAPTDTLGRQTVLIDATTGKEETEPAYLAARQSAALQGQFFNPTQGYVPVNIAHKPVFNTDYGDIAPRFSVAWNPSFSSGMLSHIFGDRKSVVRGGYSLVYDRESIIETVVIPMLGVGFGQTISNVTPSCTAAGCTGPNPAVSGFRVGEDGNIPLPTVNPISVPVIPSTPFGEVLSFQDDPNFKVGRGHNLALSIQRELPRNMLLEVGYIGRLGTHLPSSADVNQSPYFFVDPASKQSFAQAYDAVTTALLAGNAPAAQPFFENQLTVSPGNSFATANCGGGTNTACLASVPNFFTHGLTQSLFQTMDLYRFSQGLQTYDNLQTVLSELRTYAGTSTYHALFVALQKKTSSGLQFGVNYTLSKALDQQISNQNNAGDYLNSFNINASYGPSFFDRRQVFNAEYVYDLPVGGSHRLRFNNSGLDRILSGWYWSGVFSADSGLPNFAFESTQAWGVSPVLGSFVPAIPTVPSSRLNASLHTGVTGSNGIGTATDPKNGGTGLNVFADPAAAFADFRNINLSTDGRDGSANPFRDFGFWNFDSEIGKSTTIHEQVKLDFTAQILNVFNNVNFNAPNFGGPLLRLSDPATFGEVTTTFVPSNRTNSARWIELGLRVSF